eukprot:7273003-Prymnesium_polylepis.1
MHDLLSVARRRHAHKPRHAQGWTTARTGLGHVTHRAGPRHAQGWTTHRAGPRHAHETAQNPPVVPPRDLSCSRDFVTRNYAYRT